MAKKKVMLVFGTRPEAIKPTPLSEKNLQEEKAHGQIFVTGKACDRIVRVLKGEAVERYGA